MNDAATRRRVLIESVWPSAGTLREILLVGAGSLLIAAAAQLQVPLPFSPVPVTGQTLAVLLLGAAYGSRRGAATVVTYLSLGVLGLPVFAGGAAGAARLVGPTAGYLVGFLAAAYVVGLASERGWDRRPWTTAASMVVGNAIIYTLGVIWLARFVGWAEVLGAGVVPFLAGDAVKIAAATALLPTAWTLLGRTDRDRP